MRKLVGLIVLVLLGFYVGWPAWSAYRIGQAISGQDAAALAAKVDFPSVRASMRPAVTGLVERELDAQVTQAGPLGGLFGGDLKKQVLPKMVDAVIEVLVTPDNIIRIVSEGDAAASIRRIMAEKMGDLAGRLPAAGGGPVGGSGSAGVAGVPGMPGGGLGQLGDLAKQIGSRQMGGGTPAAPAAAPPSPAAGTQQPQAAGSKPSFGLGNIKGLGFDGPLGLTVAVAQNAASASADVTAGMSFSGGDWKLTKIIPRL